MSFEIKITKDYDGVKPKSFLKKKVDAPFFKIQKLIKDKRITLNGKKIKEDSIMRTGDIIKIWPDEMKPREVISNFVEKKDLGLEIIFENEDFIVFNKLPGIVVQGAQHNEGSISFHLAYYKDKIKDQSDFDYFHVHRLDKFTSGALVIAKNRITLRNLNQLFRTREVKKKYLALVVGSLKENSGSIEEFMKRNEEGSREKMSICLESDPEAKRSISNYKVLKEIDYGSETFSLVEIEIKTGITHQIRVQMKNLGCPVYGDKMYGNSFVNSEFKNDLSRQFLHAKSIEFEFAGKNQKFEAELTSDLQEFLNLIQK